MKTTQGLRSIWLACAVIAGLVATVEVSRAQGYIPSATLFATPAGGGAYNYTLTLSNASSATANIGSLWYAWIPGQFYLPSAPTSTSVPPGWTAGLFPPSGTPSSIQFSANTPGDAIAPGGSRIFGFTSMDTPATLAGNAPNFPGTPIGTSVAYVGTFFSDGGVQFVVQSVPEPSSLGLMTIGSVALATAGWRRLRRS